jgi:Bacteriophage lambda head decoration protein D
MATSPTKVSAADTGTALTTAPPRDWAFLLTEANGYRSRDTITLIQRDEPWWAGSFVTSAGDVPATPADIHGILAASCSTRTGPRAATVITRDCEVVDAYLQYGLFNTAALRKDVADQLGDLAIVLRQGVLPNVAPGSFDPNAPLTESTIVSGIPPTVPPVLTYPQPASFAPTTLEAAEPNLPGAGSPQPAPPTVPATQNPTPPPPEGEAASQPAGTITPPPAGTP